MNTKEKDSPPLAYAERNLLFLLISAAISAGLIYLTYFSIFNKEASDVKPLGFFLFVPTVLSFFQTLWFLLNPFAVFFEDKMEIRQSLFHNRLTYYVDIKKVSDMSDGSLKITYNDDDIDKINLFGVRPSHIKHLREELNKHVLSSLEKRKKPEDSHI